MHVYFHMSVNEDGFVHSKYWRLASRSKFCSFLWQTSHSSGETFSTFVKAYRIEDIMTINMQCKVLFNAPDSVVNSLKINKCRRLNSEVTINLEV